ncbi:MAG: glucose-6-phosphate dehydrogenase assembly protein OpcA [Corynebacterium sp.]|nr:glucose-6-phosphate dehydrogenase assembly protein OpcA [Corynebacterium sp.]
MIIPMPNTTTRAIVGKLVEAQEHYTLTTSRVLTLIVVLDDATELDSVLAAVRDASHEHPSRVLVVVTSDKDSAEPFVDAQLLVGGEAGASEIVVMDLHGPLTQHAESVVTPLLLPDTPIVVWWPTNSPLQPSRAPIGRLAQRRITNAAAKGDLTKLLDGYMPGDSDMAWGAITQWRGIVASSMDRCAHESVQSVTIAGPDESLAVELAAAWLADRLHVPVVREVTPVESNGNQLFPIQKLVITLQTAHIVIEVVDSSTVRVNVPGSPESVVALSKRNRAEILSEELRHLDADDAYARTLRGLAHVKHQ